MIADLSTWRVAPTLHWSEAWATWLKLDYVKRGGGELSEKSLAAYLQDARHLAKWFAAKYDREFSPELLTVENVRAYFEQQAEQKDAVNSRNRRLASLRMIVKWCIAEGRLLSDPTLRQARARLMRLPRKAKDQDEISALETVAITGSHLKRQTEHWGFLGERDYIIWAIFKNTTLRIESIVNLDAEDIFLETRILRVITKGDIEVEFPINDELAGAIEHWLKTRPTNAKALITDWNGRRLTTGQVRRRLYQIGEKAGMKVRPHDMRHTRGLEVYKKAIELGLSAGEALDVTATLMGHRDRRTTLGYLRASMEQLTMINNAT